MIPPQARAGANRANHGAVTGVDRGVVAGGNGATNVTAFIQTNIGSIQANVGSRSQSNTATGNTLSATGGDDDMATGGSATASGAGSLAVGGNADARGDDALAATGHASIGSGDSSNRAGGYTAKANRDTAAAASGGTGGDDLQTRALLSLWSRLGELVMPVTLARGWLPLLQQRSATRPRSPAPAR